MKNNLTTEMVSLFDYLGYAAGKDLGKEVARAAGRTKTKSFTRHVSNSKYTGFVRLYPKRFLDWYFTEEKEDTQLYLNRFFSTDDDKLPF